MTPKTYFSIFGVLSGLFGIGFVLAPAQVLIMYGIESTPAVGLASRLFGGTLLAVAIILWSARDFRDPAAVRAVLMASVTSDAVCRGPARSHLRNSQCVRLEHGADLSLRHARGRLPSRRGQRAATGGMRSQASKGIGKMTGVAVALKHQSGSNFRSRA
jgi:hypothetical protein